MTISQQMKRWQQIAEQDKIRFRHLWTPEKTPAPNVPVQQPFPFEEAHRDR
jgi:hypothetical protein